MDSAKRDQTIPVRATLNLWPETAGLLGLSRNSVYAAAARGDIPTIRIGGRLLVPKTALDRLLMKDVGAPEQKEG
jgi:excisionase family DNA binding protein